MSATRRPKSEYRNAHHEGTPTSSEPRPGVNGQRQFISSGSPWEALAGYSRAVAQGQWVFVSGTVGFDRAAQAWPESAQAQAETALDIIEAALEQAHAQFADVVRVRVYVPDRADVAAVSAVMKQRLGAARPANTTVCCALAVPEAKVEIEVTALRASAGDAAADTPGA